MCILCPTLLREYDDRNQSTVFAHQACALELVRIVTEKHIIRIRYTTIPTIIGQ
jgi:hypothetical protein